MFKVCKVYSGTVGGPVSVRVQVDAGNNGGAADQDFNVSLADGECRAVWTTGGNNGIVDNVTVTETGPAGYDVSLVKRTDGDGGPVTDPSVASNTTSQTMTNPNGTGVDAVVVTFTNTFVPPPAGGCTFTQGYWKNHAGFKKQADAWPVQTLAIGGIVYTKAELVEIMQAPTKGNGIMSLVQQLIAAKLNVLNGASNVGIAQAIIDADDMIDNAGGKIVSPFTNPFLAPSVTSALNTALTNYNEGATGPGHCAD